MGVLYRDLLAPCIASHVRGRAQASWIINEYGSLSSRAPAPGGGGGGYGAACAQRPATTHNGRNAWAGWRQDKKVLRCLSENEHVDPSPAINLIKTPQSKSMRTSPFNGVPVQRAVVACNVGCLMEPGSCVQQMGQANGGCATVVAGAKRIAPLLWHTL